MLGWNLSLIILSCNQSTSAIRQLLKIVVKYYLKTPFSVTTNSLRGRIYYWPLVSAQHLLMRATALCFLPAYLREMGGEGGGRQQWGDCRHRLATPGQCAEVNKKMKLKIKKKKKNNKRNSTGWHLCRSPEWSVKDVGVWREDVLKLLLGIGCVVCRVNNISRVAVWDWNSYICHLLNGSVYSRSLFLTDLNLTYFYVYKIQSYILTDNELYYEMATDDE